MATVTEILSAAENDIRTILLHKDNRYLRNLMNAAYNPAAKLCLPEGEPPYKPNSMEEGQVSPGIMWQAARQIEQFQRVYDKKLVNVRIENQFIQVLESVSAVEAKVLLAVKDQTLHKLYKGLTKEKLTDIGYFK